MENKRESIKNSKVLLKISSLLIKLKNNKILKKILDFLPHNIFIIILFLISIFTLFNFYKNKNSVILYNQGVSSNVYPPIINELNFSLKGYDINKNPDLVCIQFATYGKEINSQYSFSIYKNNKKIYRESFDSSKLKDNGYKCFDAKTINHKETEKYTIKIKAEKSDLDNAITMYHNSNLEQPSLYFLEKLGHFNVRNLLIIIFFIYFMYLNYKINNNKISIEKFWMLIFIYLIAIVFIYPPYQIPDEPAHFYNSYKLSQLDANKKLSENMNDIYVTTPKSINCLNYSKITEKDKVEDFNELIECAKNTENIQNDSYRNYKYVETKLGYVFSSFGIKVADILTNSPLIIFYTGRLFEFIVSFIIILIAIKISDKHKEIIVFLATIPMFIQQSGSYSYDSILNAISLLVIALIINMIYSKDNKFVLKSIILILLCSILVNIKWIYLPIALLMLFIPDKKFKKKYTKYLLCLLVIICSYILGKFSQSIFTGGLRFQNVTTSKNLQFILDNPTKIFLIAYNTFVLKGLFYLQSLIGYFGWFTFKISDLFIYAYIIMLIYIIKTQKVVKKNWYDIIIVLVGLLLIIGGIFGSMYFGFTEYKYMNVEGIQGRYFLPVIFPIMLLFITNKKTKETNRNIVYNFINIILFQYISILLIQFY